jgi:hypothetical protein
MSDLENVDLENMAKEYIDSTDIPSLDEFAELINTLHPKVSKKAARGILKIVFFRTTGKKI